MIICPVHYNNVSSYRLNLSAAKQFKKYDNVEACRCNLCKKYYIDVKEIKSGIIGTAKNGYKIENIHKYYPLPEELHVLSKKRMKELSAKKRLDDAKDFTASDLKEYHIPSKHNTEEDIYYITSETYISCLNTIKNLQIEIKIDDENLKQLGNQEAIEYALRFLDYVGKESNPSAFNLLKQNKKIAAAYNSANILYNPYQYLPWLYMFNEGVDSILISDEVGLGKTIEAGILIKEEYQEKENANVLIICPTFLRNKWRQELKEKFYINASIYGEQDLNNNTIILPLSRMKKFNEKNLKNYHMVIIDEVHYFRNSRSSRYQHLKQLFDHNRTERKIFMTATPINNTGNDYQAIKMFLGNNFIKTSTTKKQAYIHIPKRKIKEVYVNLYPNEQKLYDVTDQLDPFSGTIYRHIGASCLYALTKYARKYSENESEVKRELRVSLEELLIDDFDESKEIENIFEKLSLIHLDGKDSKLNSLIELIDEIEDKKIIIFSHYIETIKYLKSELEKKYRCEYIYANNFSNHAIISDKKNRFIDAKLWFDQQDTDEKTILICSDSCREGIDLDKASCLINYDLPFNPSILEQRIGRIDRMCQKSDMSIFNFHVNGTYDDRLHMILSAKLLIINYYAEYGIGNPLTIVENGASPFDKFISYFKKNSNFAMTNDDFAVIKRILRKIGVKTEKHVKQEEILSLLVKNKQKIIELFDDREFDELTDEQLIKQKEILNAKLGFSEHISGMINICSSSKKKIAYEMNNQASLKSRLSCIIIDYEQKLKNVEDTGNPMILDEDDIKSSLRFSTGIETNDDFISSGLIRWLVEQGAEVYENQ